MEKDTPKKFAEQLEGSGGIRFLHAIGFCYKRYLSYKEAKENVSSKPLPLSSACQKVSRAFILPIDQSQGPLC
jgi:hypothetical protein